ncbi:MAG: inositol monophosphatase family protein [Candidatus Omnitrophota bacterium]
MNRLKIKSTLFRCLEEAGKILSRSLHERRIVRMKSSVNLVTATDHASEKLIIKTIQRTFPGHAILAEESLAQGTASAHRWIIDPLDGTTNFAHTFPVACVSIAYEEYGEVRMGGVFDPFRNELFYAEKGKGAAMNGKKIAPSRTPTLAKSLLATGFPYDRAKRMKDYLPLFKDFLLRVQDIRRPGAAALDLCSVACGRFDGYWECNLQPWDAAAGALIVQEAGGKMSDFSGRAYKTGSFQTLAANPYLHPEMLRILRPYRHLKPLG